MKTYEKEKSPRAETPKEFRKPGSPVSAPKSVRAASNSFSLNLAAMMTDCGMTQAELAGKIGVGQTAVSLWCAGQRCPAFSLLDRICTVFSEYYPDLRVGDLINPMPELWRNSSGVSTETQKSFRNSFGVSEEGDLEE